MKKYKRNIRKKQQENKIVSLKVLVKLTTP